MTLITTIDEIVDLFPPGSVDVSEGELHSPCPFCTNGGAKTVYRGTAFWGEDRLVWFSDRAGVSCRRCGTYAKMQRLLDLIAPGSEVSADLSPSEIVKEITEPVVASDEYVNKLHAKVDRAYWRSLNWADDAIDHFKLGYGKMYEFGSYQASRHIIPFHPQRVDRYYDAWAFEGRLAKDDKSGESPNIKTKGMKGGGWFWYINEDPSSTKIAITEGLKDAITAWQLGYKNVLAIFGASAWVNSFSSFLGREGYELAHVFGDNDEAGHDFNEQACLDLHGAGIKPYFLSWDKSLSEGFDVSDLLKFQGQKVALRYVEENLKLSGQTKGRVKDFRTVDANYVAPSSNIAIPLAQIREELPDILREFKSGYKLRKKNHKLGTVKVLAAPPGSGKSHALVAFAQDEARKVVMEFEGHLIQAQKALQALKQTVVDAQDLEEMTEAQTKVDRLQRAIDNASQAKILFASPFITGWEDVINQPGFDPTLWYNFQARNKNTCENFEIANELGAKGYAVAKFCETQCPFAQRCREVGYLKQEKERKQKPITFVRHANLVSDSLLVGYKMIIIDENFLDTFAQFTEIENVRDLTPSRPSWSDYSEVNFEQYERLAHFLEAIGKTLAAKKQGDSVLFGLTYLQKLESNLGEPLVDFMKKLTPDIVREYQPVSPPAFDRVSELPRRIVEPLYLAIQDELADFERGELYNSRIHQIEGKLYVSSLFALNIPANKPIIVADGTAFAELYGYIFNRSVELYAPELFNSEAVVEQLTGTDFSRTSLRQQIGGVLYEKLSKAVETELLDSMPDILGDEVDLSKIAVTEDLYHSPALTQMFDLLMQMVDNPDYKKILFVTYKNIRPVIERRLKDLARKGKRKNEYKRALEKLSFGHYGGLRGTNRYKDHDAVLLVGCPRQPYRQMHMRIQAWARLAGKKEYIPFNVVGKAAPYHGEGVYEGYTYFTFEDEFADKFVKMYEEGEIRQCLDRIRIYSGGNKHAVLLMGRPAAKWITAIHSSRAKALQAYRERNQQLLEFIGQADTMFQKLPTTRSLADEFGISNTAAKRAVEFYKTDKKHLQPVSE